ncbi:hypothetical protein HGP14_00995 [Rhizobium sp. P32RR-XVIII]|uniref:hypothetical protein n=1 Tax=Rhizobium sp. P32RR-XVIII TaxID=2726738 RepID=UPI0014564A06|nr:hypothetical protein [Rhizobium sp. P32RR-XVIII]NLS01946.1 hypothetical protein [Rhizobium sp. P32RR-XVIII]
MTGNSTSRTPPSVGWLAAARKLLTRLWPSVFIYSAVLIASILPVKLIGAKDYVGPDNDDGMRLVEVRDFLSGQGWFDLMQYRLGVDGTPMHWSRLIDLPIAALIKFFGLFFAGEQAEAVALAIWPVSLIIPLMLAMAIAGRRIGGAPAMHISLGMTALGVWTTSRFMPGAIDHHNAQIGLVAMMTAMLLDERHSIRSYVIAGLTAALAIAIGVETTPFVAAVCIVVALHWAVEGQAFRNAASAFGLTLALAISVLFFSTVAPHLYSTVTCDNFSLGFYSLAAIGGGLLAVAATLASRSSRTSRFVALGGIGIAVAASAVVIAPQCLHNPLDDLDPMLVKLWLNNISEARSVVAMIRAEPFGVGALYAVGLLGIAVCAFRILYRDRVRVHAILLFLLVVCWGIGLMQVRGVPFANLIAILPLALLVIDIRRISNNDRENVVIAFCYIMLVLASVPAVWAVGGALIEMQRQTQEAKEDENKPSCRSREALAPLNAMPVGMVAASSELGVPILRFTGQHVLTAPYHRNPQGMLTEMHIGLSEPKDAEAFLRGAGVSVLAFCPDDYPTMQFAKLKPDGLYSQLAKGNVPSYLQPLPKAEASGVQFFLFKPEN